MSGITGACMHWSEYSRFAISLFVLLGAFMKVPMLLSLLGGNDQSLILRSATVAGVTALTILLIAQFAGEWILISVGTSLPSFQMGGGLIILLTGLSLVRGGSMNATAVESRRDALLAFRIGISPLGTPALAGGGSITTVILETHTMHSPLDDLAITTIISGNCLVAWAILVCAPRVGQMLGPNGIVVMERIFGLLMVAIGIEIMTKGFANHLARMG